MFFFFPGPSLIYPLTTVRLDYNFNSSQNSSQVLSVQDNNSLSNISAAILYAFVLTLNKASSVTQQPYNASTTLKGVLIPYIVFIYVAYCEKLVRFIFCMLSWPKSVAFTTRWHESCTLFPSQQQEAMANAVVSFMSQWYEAMVNTVVLFKYQCHEAMADYVVLFTSQWHKSIANVVLFTIYFTS